MALFTVLGLALCCGFGNENPAPGTAIGKTKAAPGHTQLVSQIWTDPTGQWLFSVGTPIKVRGEYSIRKWNLKTAKPADDLPGFLRKLDALSMPPVSVPANSSKVAYGTFEGEFYRCYLASASFKDPANVLTIESNRIGCDPKLFISPGEKKLVCLVSTKNPPEKIIARARIIGGAEIYIHDWTKGRGATRRLTINTPIISSMSAMIQESFCLALVNDRRSVVIYDLKKGEAIGKPIQAPKDTEICSVLPFAEGSKLCIGLDDGSVVLVDLSRQAAPTRLQLSASPIVALAPSGKDGRLFAGDGSGFLHVVNPATKTSQKFFNVSMPIFCLAPIPGGKRIAIASSSLGVDDDDVPVTGRITILELDNRRVDLVIENERIFAPPQ